MIVSGNFSDELKREPTLALRMEEELLESIRKRWGSGAIDTSSEEGVGMCHRGTRHLKKSLRAFSKDAK